MIGARASRQRLNATGGVVVTYLDSWLPLATNCFLKELTISSDVVGSNPSTVHIVVALESKLEEDSLMRGARFWNNRLKVCPSIFALGVWSCGIGWVSWSFGVAKTGCLGGRS